MNIEELIDERKYLQKIVDEAVCRLVSYPDGTLEKNITHGRYFQYCLILGNKKNYLSKRRKQDLIKLYAQKKQDIEILKKIPKQIKIIDIFLSKYNPSSLNEIFSECKKYCEFYEPIATRLPEKEILKSVSAESIENSSTSDDTDLARNLISICEAFLKSKGC